MRPVAQRQVRGLGQPAHGGTLRRIVDVGDLQRVEKPVGRQRLGGSHGGSVAALKFGMQHELHDPDVHVGLGRSIHGGNLTQADGRAAPLW